MNFGRNFFHLRIFSTQCHEHHYIVERAWCQGQWTVVVFTVGQDAEKVGLAGQRAFTIGYNHFNAVRHHTRCEIVPSFIFTSASPALVHMMLGEFCELSAVGL